jgi:flagellar basal-body rod modification protein FlgD
LTVAPVESTGGPYGTVGTGSTGAATTGPTTQGTGTSADKDMFMQLLVAQMRYQDPSNPTDSSQFLAQSAQFTALEKMQTVADQTTQLVGLQVAFGASTMVGKTVSYPSSDGSIKSGVVTAARFESTGPVLQVNGEEVPFTSVRAIGDGSTDLTTFQPAT